MERAKREKKIVDMIEVKEGHIQEAPTRYKVDTIVNAAKPTLMGNDNGVDGAIHNAVDTLNGKNGYLREKIKEQLDKEKTENNDRIRCQRGQVVFTEGYSLCNTIIHTVGPKSDCMDKNLAIYSSSSLEVLEMCYKNIILESLKKPEIKKIGIPVISSGNYGIQFDRAFTIGLTTVYNTLLEIKQRDKEFFEFTVLEKIYFIIPRELDTENFEHAEKILENYTKYFEKETRVISRKSRVRQKEFLREIELYDECRGYFSVAKICRKQLVNLRMFVFPFFNWVKDCWGKEDWIHRRKIVEKLSILKMLLPVLGYFIIQCCLKNRAYFVVEWCSKEKISYFIGIFMLYNLLDTTTYLLSLIVLADIQRFSANIIRSLIMLCINYIEISMEISLIYYINYYPNLRFIQAITFGILGEKVEDIVNNIWIDNIILYLNAGVKFFFLTLVFGYFANHLTERKFRQV